MLGDEVGKIARLSMSELNAASTRSPAVAVVGAGPAGLTAAITLAAAGVPTVLAGQRPADNRTTALLAGSVTAFETLGVWPRCAEHAAALRAMRIVDDTGRLLRAPEVKFDAAEIGLDAFGQNIENRHLLAALAEQAHTLKELTWIEDRVECVATDSHGATVSFADGKAITVPLVIGADGRNSLCRTAAGISVGTHRYPQSAITVCLSHGRPHHDISTEIHTANGPFTLVPLPGQRSSLVWVMDPDHAEIIAAFTDKELAIEIERRSHAILGKIMLDPGRGLFPLTMTRAQRFAANRIALVGEAAHVIPPIGAQGLNLGLRDAASIGELVVDAWRGRRDPGADSLLADYDRQRRADVGSRALAIDFLNRSLLSDFLPVQSVRGLGLYLIDRIGPLRRALMREGVAPTAGQPRLMRGQAL
jgi:2-octaprenyl-6-methoxyphenol hydroxylase